MTDDEFLLTVATEFDREVNCGLRRAMKRLKKRKQKQSTFDTLETNDLLIYEINNQVVLTATKPKCISRRKFFWVIIDGS